MIVSKAKIIPGNIWGNKTLFGKLATLFRWEALSRGVLGVG
jgi:hypothetical protein